MITPNDREDWRLQATSGGAKETSSEQKDDVARSAFERKPLAISMTCWRDIDATKRSNQKQYLRTYART